MAKKRPLSPAVFPPLRDLLAELERLHGLTPFMGAEIEFYACLPDTQGPTLDAFFGPIQQALREANHPLLRIEKERGPHQFEIVTSITTPELLADTLRTIRRLVEARGEATQTPVHFAAKPFPDAPSSGLHLHLHLAQADGENAYWKTEDTTSRALRYSLGGLLATLPDALPIFFPTEADRARLSDPDHVPKAPAWGVNNRYCTLRIPAFSDPYHKWIEHRLPCANADPEAAIVAMLHGVLHGLTHATLPPAQEYGKPTTPAGWPFS